MSKSSRLMPHSTPELVENKSLPDGSRGPGTESGARPEGRPRPPFQTVESERSSWEPVHPTDRYRFSVVYDDRQKMMPPAKRVDRSE